MDYTLRSHVRWVLRRRSGGMELKMNQRWPPFNTQPAAEEGGGNTKLKNQMQAQSQGMHLHN